jgi:Ca2+-binding EF-hand superfamily protein
MYAAVENGARWTLRHFLKPLGLSEQDSHARHTFESFASWYSTGGYNIAPWLELLDLKKLLCLVADDDMTLKSPTLTHDALPAFPGPKTSSPEFDVSPPPSYHPRSHQRHLRHGPTHPHNTTPRLTGPPTTPFGISHPAPEVQVLFTFPLANQCSLVVLRDDATYVRGVVDQLGLLSTPAEEVWSTLFNIASKKPPLPPVKSKKKMPKITPTGKSMLVNKEMFVECMQETIQIKASESKKRSASGMSKTVSGSHDVLANFFQSFDLLQTDRVSLSELMGGLTLLCGGKKSTKLSFAFSVFDRRQSNKKKGKKMHSLANSLDGEELFLFLRSFLIVMFSCCQQSWDLSDDAVNRYIADTANMIADDVMRYQWRTRKKERVDFDEFGQWYNEGGFETAPWLELLDLTKWVLVDNFDDMEKHRPPLSPGVGLVLPDSDCPPPPPDADVDPSFFDDDGPGIMHMESIDEMDLLLLQQPSHDKEDFDFSKLTRSFPFSPKPSPKPQPPPQNANSLKFHLLTKDNHDGYVVSVSHKRINHLRHVLLESGLNQIDGEHACREILGKAQRVGSSHSGASKYVLSKRDFDSAMVRIITSRSMSVETQTTLTSILREIFSAFDFEGTGKANAFDVACGFTVLCQGKKSDKLEYAFEILDRGKQGFLSRSDTIRYLRSFLIVLLTMVTTDSLDTDFNDDVVTTVSGEKCERSMAAVSQAIEMGCRWASDQAMQSHRDNHDGITFDDFADWYTRIGYNNIPWLELLDLNKWVINGDVAPAHTG